MLCIPAIIASCILDVVECLAKIKDRRWTPFVCITYLFCNLTGMAIGLYMINQPNIFTNDFVSYIMNHNWGEFDIMRLFGSPVSPLMILNAIIIIGTIIGCLNAIYKTWRTSQQAS